MKEHVLNLQNNNSGVLVDNFARLDFTSCKKSPWQIAENAAYVMLNEKGT